MELEHLDEDRWADIHTFRYTGWRFDGETGVAEFDYLHQGSAQELAFTDSVTFPLPSTALGAAELAAFHRVLELLYVAIGTIYYKGVAPATVSLGDLALAPAAARWTQQLYRQGLAEFAYRWTLPHVLDLAPEIRPRAAAVDRDDLATTDRLPVVAIGGGKDSIVSAEVLRAAGFRPASFAVQRELTPLLSQMMTLAGPPGLLISRHQDPRMTELLRTNSMRVGHVPVTAINSLAGVAVAALHGLGPVVMSNERSADEGNLIWHGHQVNHQWSKGVAAEQLLTDALSEHAGLGNACFSLLRGMSEVGIARLFAATDGYDELMTSCNYAFRMSHQERTARWCNKCAKCRFVFLALAPFTDRLRLVGIFGSNLLDDEAQLDGYRELLGLTGHKPFECVGELAESRVAAMLAVRQPAWENARVIQQLVRETPAPSEQVYAEVLAVQLPRFAPARYAEALASFMSVGREEPAPL